MTYQDAYEHELGALLREYIQQNADAGAAARQDFFDRITARGEDWGEGKFGYAVGHYADDVIEAETRSRYARVVAEGLGADDPKAPSAVLEHVLAVAARDTSAALQGGRSTNQWHNLVIAEIGRAAANQSETDRWHGLAALAPRAQHAAVRMLAKDQLGALQARKDRVRELAASIDRARSDTRKAELQQEREQADQRVAVAQDQVRAQLALAGAPEDLVATAV